MWRCELYACGQCALGGEITSRSEHAYVLGVCACGAKEPTISVGAVVGISIGSAAALGIGGFAIFWFVIKKRSFADLIAVFKK